jgi:hypothetical protein
MKMKIACAVILAAFGLSAVAADKDKMDGKKHRVSISDTLKVGTAELKPGQYDLVMGSPTVRFVHIQSGDETAVPATFRTEEKKHATTAVVVSEIEGGKHLKEILLGGSKTTVAFR